MLLNQLADDGAGLIRIARPVNMAPGFDDVGLKLLQVEIEVAHDVRLDGAARVAKLFPVGHLAHDFAPLVANYVRGMADVVAQLAVLQRFPRRLGKRARLRGPADADAHANGSPSVEASTSAMCAVLTPGRSRWSAPKMCIRQDLSVAPQTSPPVSRLQPPLPTPTPFHRSTFFTQ